MGLVPGLRSAQGDHGGKQRGTVYLVGFDDDRRVLREHSASSTQDIPGHIDIGWIPGGIIAFSGLSARGLDDEDIYNTPCSKPRERLPVPRGMNA